MPNFNGKLKRAVLALADIILVGASLYLALVCVLKGYSGTIYAHLRTLASPNYFDQPDHFFIFRPLPASLALR